MNREEMVLVKVMEECSEVQKVISKTLSFGWDSVCPGQEKTNLEQLQDEYNDLLGAVEMLRDMGYYICADPDKIQAKKDKIERYFEICEDIGTLSS